MYAGLLKNLQLRCNEFIKWDVYFSSKPRSRRGEKREKKDDFNDDEDGGKVCN